MNQFPIAKITMENNDMIEIRLRPDQAPNTVKSFIWLASKGVYNGHSIQRIVPGYVLDASYTAFNHPDAKYLIPNESRCMGVENTLPVEPGYLCMGGYEINQIAGGEFFFPFAYHEKLQGRYPAFGEVINGWENIAKLEHIELKPVPNDIGVEINEPITPVVIRSVEILNLQGPIEEPYKLSDPIPANWL